MSDETSSATGGADTAAAPSAPSGPAAPAPRRPAPKGRRRMSVPPILPVADPAAAPHEDGSHGVDETA